MNRAAFADQVHLQGDAVRGTGSPFYGLLMDHIESDVRAGGPFWELMSDHADLGFGAMVPLRLLGGAHRLALEGAWPDLARHYASTGGDGDPDAAWVSLREGVLAHAGRLRPLLDQPPQTNEVGRSAGLLGGFLTVARTTGLPLRLLELGPSGGLNLRFDAYFYDCNGATFGDARSPVQFVDVFEGGCPPLATVCTVVERRGCDRHPVDATTEDGRLTLLSYLWPDQPARIALLRAAFDVAARVPVQLEAGDVTEWLPNQLATATRGVVTIVFHSIMWQYLDAEQRAAVTAALHEAGARASADAPLAWVRLEPTPESGVPELRVTQWPGGGEELLARSGFHGPPVQWLASQPAITG